MADDVLHQLGVAAMEALPTLLVPSVLAIPIIVAEQVWPARERPGWRDYGINLAITVLTVYLALPIGLLAGLTSTALHHYLPWHTLPLPFAGAGGPLGSAGRILTLTFVPLLIHDAWFYWAHRIEHRLGVLWEFHKLHHGDLRMNCTTFFRDHVLQNAWRSFFSIFTTGLLFDLDAAQAGAAGIYSGLFLMLLTMLYHSAIRLPLRWLDFLVVTPQTHRIHHSIEPEDFDHNFADVFPIFDIVFGTFRRAPKGYFPATGLPRDELGGYRVDRAVLGPIMGAWDKVFRDGRA
ncbi:sterol desaturase family protein [Novosphingobium sp. KACC 22771]|uniref:sterol desaturase family protein n=1 Tax=Novosphingobium sp. KACC 22771 TaxID=3025670 RepID=UPI002364FC52|nr:sterol desaturase family protein [Novosphingobium sp. KACC 22771]WDF74319.1 sterol desaturase family protein [Novosphingobium sp. KACC 22771]